MVSEWVLIVLISHPWSGVSMERFANKDDCARTIDGLASLAEPHLKPRISAHCVEVAPLITKETSQ